MLLRNIYFAHFSAGSRGSMHNKTSKYRTNREIRASEVRLVGSDGKMIGVVSIEKALHFADEKGLDLVEIAPQAKPPVCKLINFGKFLYEQQKKEKHQRKQQLNQQMKEVRFKWRTDTHDFNFKVRHARGFIEDGHKVKASVMFRGREIVHKEIGIELLKKFVTELEDVAKVDQPLRSEGRIIHVVLSPEKGKSKTKKTD